MDVEELYDGFVSGTPRVGLWLDTTDLTAEKTVDEILGPDELVHGASELDLTPYRLERSSGEAVVPETLVL